MNAPIPEQRVSLLNPIQNETNRNRRLRSRMSLAFTGDVPEDAEYRYKETIAITELLFDGASPISYRGLGAPAPSTSLELFIRRFKWEALQTM